MTTANRIDALSQDRRLRGLTDPLLDHGEDPTLQRIVREAASAVGAPIALVSLVLDNIQLFRAQFGLPADLAHAAATDRDVSFCQFAVRDDALFEVEDAVDRHDLPQALVRSHGIRAYLGAPIHLDGQALGSLCVIDTRPRQFTAEQRRGLRRLAAEVDARLAEWSHARSAQPAAADRATTPVLADMRDRLNVLACARDELRITRAELLADQRAYDADGERFGPFSLARRLRARVSQVSAVLHMLDRSAAGMGAALDQLEGLVHRGDSTAAPARVVELAAHCCALTAEAAGGIVWGATEVKQDIARPAAGAALLLTSAVNVVFGEAPRSYRGGISVTLSEAPGRVSFEVAGPPVGDARLRAAWDALDEGLFDTAGVRCVVGRGRLTLQLPAVPR